jgi:hypothetical protein
LQNDNCKFQIGCTPTSVHFAICIFQFAICNGVVEQRAKNYYMLCKHSLANHNRWYLFDNAICNCRLSQRLARNATEGAPYRYGRVLITPSSGLLAEA